MAEKASNKEWLQSTIGKRRQHAQTESGTATGIVRRIEGVVLGLVAKMVTIAGTVIVYGTMASVIYGVIYWIITLF